MQGEFDAMAVYQATRIPAVSLPNGASSLPLGVLPLLERFDKIYLWMDHDGPGQAGVEKFVQKLVRQGRGSVDCYAQRLFVCMLMPVACWDLTVSGWCNEYVGFMHNLEGLRNRVVG